MEIRRSRAGILELRQSRLQAGLGLAFFVFFFATWYSVLFAASPSQTDASFMAMLLFYGAPLLALPEIVRQVRVLTTGEVFTVDSDRGVIERNGNRIGRFDEVERVQIRTIHHSEGRDEYRLSIVLTNEEKARIEQSTDLDHICEVADDIADLVGVDVVIKGRKEVLSEHSW